MLNIKRNTFLRHCETKNIGSDNGSTPKQSRSYLQKTGRNAEITVELVLAIALAVVALFLTLGLFSQNLKFMVVNSNISNMFANNALTKTKNTSWAANPMQSQVNVQLVGSQGLQWYLTQAQKAIAKYKATPPKNGAEVQDLAKQATIARIADSANGLSGEDEGLFSTSQYGGIQININTRTPTTYQTKITSTNKSIDYKIQTTNTNPLYITSDQLKMIRTVISATFK